MGSIYIKKKIPFLEKKWLEKNYAFTYLIKYEEFTFENRCDTKGVSNQDLDFAS